MWEVTLLDQHYYPWVQSYAKHIAQGAPSTGPHSLNAKHARAQPHEIFEALDCSQHGFSFNPAMQKPKPHALFKAGDTGRKRRIGLLNPRVVGPSTVAAGVVRSGAAKVSCTIVLPLLVVPSAQCVAPKSMSQHVSFLENGATVLLPTCCQFTTGIMYITPTVFAHTRPPRFSLTEGCKGVQSLLCRYDRSD
jgi:hypothetical protein